jgi:hypothetical protein
VERAKAGLTCGIVQIDLPVRMRIDPQCGFHRAATIPGSRCHRLVRSSGNHLDKPAGEDMSDFVETDIAAAIGRRLGQFAKHHQFGQRRRDADPPDLGPVADRFHKLRA